MRLPALAAAGLLALAGCANHPIDRPDIETEAMANPEAALKLALNRVARATEAMRTAGPAGVSPAELQRPIVWKWRGPLDQGAKALAERVGYAYAEPGPDAPTMPTVTVDADGTSALEIFRSMGTQAGDRAVLMVDPDRRIVQVKRNA